MFAQIFTEMSWLPMMLLSLGFILILIEVFVPGFGFFGVCGLGCLIGGVVVRICQGLNIEQSLTLVLLVLGVITIGGFIITFSARYGILSKTGLFETKSTLSKDYFKLTKEQRKLIGKSGKTISNLSLGGQAKINGKIYDVQSISSYIPAGVNIKVVEIKNNQIRVRKWFE